MTAEVIVVDDNREAAKGFARYIEISTQLKTISTDDPDEAVKMVESNEIKVAVLDQRMPKMDGTDLFAELRKIDPFIKGVMLTGEAEAKDVGAALSLGFSDYVHKSKVLKIAPSVLQYFCEYHADILADTGLNEQILGSYSRGFPWSASVVEFRLASVEVLSDSHVFPKSWRTVVRLDAGEKKKETLSWTGVSRIVFETEEKQRLLGSASAKIPLVDGLTAKLDIAIESRFKTQESHELEESSAIEREFKLPDEPGDPDKKHVKSRQYERAPVYKKFRAIISKSCTCCNCNSVVPVTVFQLTTKVATRMID